MKIGIDVSQTVYKGTGVARYTTSLIKGLMKYDTQNEYVLFFSSLRQKLPQEIAECINDHTVIKQYPFPPSFLNLVWNKLHILPIENFTGKLDVFFSSDWTEPPVRGAKKITTIHDLVPYLFPETLQHKTTLHLQDVTLSQNIVETHKQRLEWVNKESTVITCNSKTTLKDAHRLLEVELKRLRVVYPGVEIQKNPRFENEFKMAFPMERPYILTVGTLQPRKNIQRLIEAFTVANLPNIDLYIVGLQGWGEELHSKNPRIKLLGYVKDEFLPYLYQNAHFFIYPALYEGFGYPVVEAMKMGAAVATSDTSSLKEIAEGYALLFDPYSQESIASAMHQLLTDGKLRKQLKEKSKKRAEDFSIEKFANGFLSVFNSLV